MAENVIQIPDETDALLTQLCRMTQMGRGRVIAVALEIMAEQWTGRPESVQALETLVARVRNARTFLECTQDALEVAKLPS